MSKLKSRQKELVLLIVIFVLLTILLSFFVKKGKLDSQTTDYIIGVILPFCYIICSYLLSRDFFKSIVYGLIFIILQIILSFLLENYLMIRGQYYFAALFVLFIILVVLTWIFKVLSSR